MTRPSAAWRLRVHEELESTSDLVKRLAAEGEPEGLAVLAIRQTAGRGTGGRRWESSEGNLHLSVLLRPTEPARTLHEWSLLAGVAAHDALAPRLADRSGLRLKWPNDLLLGDAKVAGVLIEAEARPDGRLDWLCIGIGANLASAPSLPDRRTTSLPPPAPTPREVAPDVLGSLAAWMSVRLREGFGPIRRAWLDRGPTYGTHMIVRSAGAVLEGTFAGMGDDGSLLLRTDGGVQALRAGDVRG